MRTDSKNTTSTDNTQTSVAESTGVISDLFSGIAGIFGSMNTMIIVFIICGLIALVTVGPKMLALQLGVSENGD
jgi:hypothetical protein